MRRTIKVTKKPTVTVARKTPRRAGRVLRAVSLGLAVLGLVGAAVAVVGARVLAETPVVETDGETAARLNREIRAAIADLRAEVAVTKTKADALAAANAEARDAFAKLADSIAKK